MKFCRPASPVAGYFGLASPRAASDWAHVARPQSHEHWQAGAAALPAFVANFGLMRGVNNFRPAPRSRASAAAGSDSRGSGAAPMPALPV